MFLRANLRPIEYKLQACSDPVVNIGYDCGEGEG